MRALRDSQAFKLSTGQVTRLRDLAAAGFSDADIADLMGLSEQRVACLLAVHRIRVRRP